MQNIGSKQRYGNSMMWNNEDDKWRQFPVKYETSWSYDYDKVEGQRLVGVAEEGSFGG